MFNLTLNPQPVNLVKVATPGVPVQFTSTTTGAGGNFNRNDDLSSNKIEFNAHGDNIGRIYIGRQNMVRGTLAAGDQTGVIKILEPGQSWSLTHNVGLNKYHAADYFIDADNAGDGVYGNADVV